MAKLTVVKPYRLIAIFVGAVASFAFGGTAVGFAFLLGALIGSVEINGR